jgi:two-component sensor histidine kinase
MQRLSSAMEREIQQIRCRQRFYPRAKPSVRAARHFVREALADWAVPDRADDILLCVSELATNALCHGVPPGRGLMIVVALADKWGVGERVPGKVV